jgi:hypothetical protein
MNAFATLAAASFLSLAGASALAQAPAPSPPPASTPTPEQQAERGRMSRAEIDALTDARVAALRAGLRLNADQQRLFPPVEQALRAIAADRAQRVEERRAQRAQPQRPDLLQRLERRAEITTQTGQRLTALAEAMKPFYASLDDSQKRLLPVLLRPVAGYGPRRMAMHDHGGRRGGMRERGPQQQQP